MSEIIIYQAADRHIELRVQLENDTIWLSQKQMADVFDTEVPAINKHIKNILASGELPQGATVSKMEIVQTEGKRKIKRTVDAYNLDMIISVGYRASIQTEGELFNAFSNLNRI